MIPSRLDFWALLLFQCTHSPQGRVVTGRHLEEICAQCVYNYADNIVYKDYSKKVI